MVRVDGGLGRSRIGLTTPKFIENYWLYINNFKCFVVYYILNDQGKEKYYG